MLIQFISDSPDTAATPVPGNLGRPGSGDNVRICIDSSGKIHLAYTVNNQLTYATSSPGQFILVPTSLGVPRFTQAFEYTLHDNAMPSPWNWDSISLFDLAVDSQGRAHLAFQGVEQTDRMTLGDVQHAVWDGNQFVSANILAPGALSVILTGIAITIANDDSVHIAYADQFGLHYATRGASQTNFQLLDVDTQKGNRFNLSIAVGSGGTTGISYMFLSPPSQQLSSGVVQLRYAQKMTATSWIVDTADQGPLQQAVLGEIGSNSLAIDAAGIPHIAYCDGAMRIRHGTWTAAGQGFWVVGPFGNGEIVDPLGSSNPTKILLDEHGNLYIAYQSSGHNVMLATTLGFPGWGAVTADASTSSGWSISAAMHPKSGEPHIAYGCPLAIATSGTLQLKHSWGLNLMLQPPPRPPKKPPINIVKAKLPG
jgi:hypothetical protein